MFRIGAFLTAAMAGLVLLAASPTMAEPGRDFLQIAAMQPGNSASQVSDQIKPLGAINPAKANVRESAPAPSPVDSVKQPGSNVVDALKPQSALPQPCLTPHMRC